MSHMAQGASELHIYAQGQSASKQLVTFSLF